MVTIVIPVFNERMFIGECLDSLLLQDIGVDNLEILVVDGGSNDGTQQVIEEISNSNPQVKLLRNPEKFTVHAFNIGILNSSDDSDYITFLNCHAVYSKDRLRRSIGYLAEYGADVVGGCSRAISRQPTLLGRTIASVLRSRFATGSIFRTELSSPQFTDTASGCLYKKELFSQIGLFNKKLIYSQDIEFNRRVRLAGKKILYVPDIITNYRSRADLYSFLKHSFRNGVWVVLPFVYSEIIPVSFRHVLPGLIFVAFLITSLLALLGVLPNSFVFCFLALYAGGAAVASMLLGIKNKSVNIFGMALVVFPLFHGVYALGSLVGGIRAGLVKVIG